MAYTTPTTRAAGYVVPYTTWNSDVVDNVIALRTGAIALTSQAAGDVIYATSSSQFGRVAIGTSGYVLTSNGTAPAWSNTPTLSGANFSSIPETAITDGSLLARVGGSETITGAWSYTQLLSGASFTSMVAFNDTAESGGYFRWANADATRRWTFQPGSSYTGLSMHYYNGSAYAETARFQDDGFYVPGTLRAATTVNVQRAFSDTAGSGPAVEMYNADGTRRWAWQPDSSNNLDLHYYNGSSWTVPFSVDTTGAMYMIGATAYHYMQAPGVNIPMTAIAPATTYGLIRHIDSGGGGLTVYGLSDTDQQAINVVGVIGSSNPADTTPAIGFQAGKSNGATSWQALDAAETVLQVTNFGTALLRVLGDGDIGMLAASKLYFDGIAGTGDTYLYEVSANQLRAVVGGVSTWDYLATGTYTYQDLVLSPTFKLRYDSSLSGDTYTYESAANTLVDVVGGVTTFERTAGAIKVLGTEGGAATIHLWADEGDDSADKWSLSASTVSHLLEFSANGTVVLDVSYGSSLPQMTLHGSSNITLNAGISSAGNIVIASGNYGSTGGASVVLGHNSNGSTPAGGYVNFKNLSGVSGFVWQDGSNNLRIGSAEPTNANDTSGTVVGTQTSQRSTKNIHGEFTRNADALALLTNTPVFEFDYKSGAYNGQRFIGITTDDSPEFGMDLGRSFNPVSAFGYTVAAFKALTARVAALEARCVA